MSEADGRLGEEGLGLGMRVSVRWSAADWVAVLAVLAVAVWLLHEQVAAAGGWILQSVRQ